MHTLMSHACAFQTTGRGHATRTRSTCFVRELRHPNLPQQKARRLAPSAPVPAVQRLGPHLDGPGTQGVPISHRVAPIPPEQGRLSGAQPAAPAPRAPRPGQLLGPRLGTTGTPGRRHMPAHARRLRAGARSARRARRGSRVAACIAVARAPRFPAARLSASAVLWAQELRSRGVGLAAGARIVQAPGLPPAPAPQRKGRPSPLKGVAFTPRAPATRSAARSTREGLRVSGSKFPSKST